MWMAQTSQTMLGRVHGAGKQYERFFGYTEKSWPLASYGTLGKLIHHLSKPILDVLNVDNSRNSQSCESEMLQNFTGST